MAAAEVEASNGQRQAAVQRRIVAECLEPGASVSLVARRHDLNTNMLFTWQRQLRAGATAPTRGGLSEPA
jgi:transposase-like protein